MSATLLRGQGLRGWHDRTLANPAFRAWAARFPLTRPLARRRARALFDLCAGFAYSQVLFACIELELFEHLAPGPLALEAIAQRIGLTPKRARILCDAATGLSLARRAGNSYALGTLGAALIGNEGVLAMIRHHHLLYRDLSDPVALLRRPRTDTQLATYWPYGTAADPAALSGEAVAPYSDLMASSQPMVAAELLAAYDIHRHRHLLDLGGGDGAFAEAAAQRAPDLRVTVFDLPEVAARARARFARASLSARAGVACGDLRGDDLPRTADLVTLIRVIHDHDDADALAILRNARAALPQGGTLLVAEPFAGAAGAESVGTYFAVYLLALGSGRPRTRAEHIALLRAAGFGRIRTRRTGNPLLTSLLVAHP